MEDFTPASGRVVISSLDSASSSCCSRIGSSEYSLRRLALRSVRLIRLGLIRLDDVAFVDWDWCNENSLVGTYVGQTTGLLLLHSICGVVTDGVVVVVVVAADSDFWSEDKSG